MKKKALLYLLLMLCLASISGCGKAQEKQQTETEDDEDKPRENSKSSEKKDKKSTDTGKEDAKQKLLGLLGKDDLSPLPVIRLEPNKKQWYKPDSTDLLCEMTYETIHLDDPDYAALSEALTSYCNANSDELLNQAEQSVNECNTDSNLMNLIDEYSYYSFDTSYKHTRFDHKVLSIFEYYSDYLLGPHGSYYYKGVTFDVKTGSQLALSDLIEGDYSAFESFAKDYMVSELLASDTENYFSPTELTSTINGFELGTEVPWYLNGNGLVFIFNTYLIGPYSMGSKEVCIPYTELTSYMKEDFLPTNGTYIAELSADTPCCYGGFRQDNNSTNQEATDTMDSQTICINTAINGEYDGVSVTTDVSDTILTDYGYLSSAYFIRKSDGNDYLFTCVDLMSGDYETNIYQIKDGVLTEINSLSGYCLKGGTLFENTFVCSAYFYVLGTYSADITYDWNEDNSLTMKDDIFNFNVINWIKMTTQIELPVTIDGEDTFLPVGTEIQIIGYDGDSTVFFRIVGTEETGEIKVEQDDYQYLINGVSEYDYFDFVPYAG